MTKIESAIQMIDWRMEDAQKEIEEMRGRIKDRIDSDRMWVEAEWVLHYAQNMAEAARKLCDLGERKAMLESIAEEA